MIQTYLIDRQLETLDLRKISFLKCHHLGSNPRPVGYGTPLQQTFYGARRPVGLAFLTRQILLLLSYPPSPPNPTTRAVGRETCVYRSQTCLAPFVNGACSCSVLILLLIHPLVGATRKRILVDLSSDAGSTFFFPPMMGIIT